MVKASPDPPQHLSERAISVELALSFADEAESFASLKCEAAHRLATHAGGIFEGQRVLRIPGKKVRLFDGIFYSGTFTGFVNEARFTVRFPGESD